MRTTFATVALAFLSTVGALPYAPNHRHHRRDDDGVLTVYETILETVYVTAVPGANSSSSYTSYSTGLASVTESSEDGASTALPTTSTESVVVTTSAPAASSSATSYPATFVSTPLYTMDNVTAPVWSNTSVPVSTPETSATSSSEYFTSYAATSSESSSSYPASSTEVASFYSASSTEVTSSYPASSEVATSASSYVAPVSSSVASSSEISAGSATSYVPTSSSSIALSSVVASASVSAANKGVSTPAVSSAAASSSAVVSSVVSSATSVAASSTISSATSSSASASPTSSSVSGKRGLAWIPGTDLGYSDNFVNKGINWYYNWGSYSSGLSSSFEYVLNQHDASSLSSASSVFTGGATVIGFNEPDLSAAGNPIDAATAASYYLQYLTPLRESGAIGYLGSPAISNVGEDWLSEFMSACSDCKIDFIACHWYGIDFSNLQDYINSLANYGLPIWLTEFACTNWDDSNLPSLDEVKTLMTSALGFLDGHGSVERYSWFAPATELGAGVGNNNALISSSGGLSEVGEIYIS
ncbi:Cell wall protein Asl1 [Schizosaccharomyces pombe]